MEDKTASEQIDDIIKIHAGWKGDLLSQLRTVIKSADPAIIEEVKWKMRTRPEGLAVWSRDGILCRLEIFKNDAKLVFSKGAQMDDADSLFNARLDSSSERAIEFCQDDSINETGIKALIFEAIKLNSKRG